MRRAAKVDKNQPEIVKALRSIGAGVVHTHQLKNAFDIIILYRGKSYHVEIKDGSLSPSQRRLSEGENKCKELFEANGVNYYVINSVEEAIKLITT